MDLSAILKELVKKQEVILNKYNFNVEDAVEKDREYNTIKGATEEIVKAINKVNSQKILGNSYIFVNEKIEEDRLEDLIDWEIVNNALEIQ